MMITEGDLPVRVFLICRQAAVKLITLHRSRASQHPLLSLCVCTSPRCHQCSSSSVISIVFSNKHRHHKDHQYCHQQYHQHCHHEHQHVSSSSQHPVEPLPPWSVGIIDHGWQLPSKQLVPSSHHHHHNHRLCHRRHHHFTTIIIIIVINIIIEYAVHTTCTLFELVLFYGD